MLRQPATAALRLLFLVLGGCRFPAVRLDAQTAARQDTAFRRLHTAGYEGWTVSRYRQTSGVLRFAARESYDRYLKANRVERGIESYDAVVQLILGTPLDASGNPRLR